MPIIAKATGRIRDIRLIANFSLPNYIYRVSPSGDAPDSLATGSALLLGGLYNPPFPPSVSSWNGFSVMPIGIQADIGFYNLYTEMQSPDGDVQVIDVHHAGDTPPFGSGSSNVSVSGEARFEIKGVEEWVVFRRTSPFEGIPDSDFPQKGYTSVVADETPPFSQLPFKNGTKAGLLFTRLSYFEMIPENAPFNAHFSMNGQSVSHSGRYSTSRSLAYGLDFALTESKSKAAPNITCPAVDAQLSVHLEDDFATYPFNFSLISYNTDGNVWTGSIGNLRGQAPDAPQSEFFDVITKTTLCQGSCYPDIQIGVSGRVCQPNGAQWNSNVQVKYTWDWNGAKTDPPEENPDYLNGCAAHTLLSGVHKSGYSLMKIAADITNQTSGVTYGLGASFRRDHQQPLGIWIHSLSGQDANHWRILHQDPYYIKPGKIKRTGSYSVDDFSTPGVWQETGGALSFVLGTLVYTAPALSSGGFYRECLDAQNRELFNFDWSFYRFLSLGLTSTVNQSVTLRLHVRYRDWTIEEESEPGYWVYHTKDYAIECSPSFSGDIDLKCPTNVSFGFPSVDSTDSAQDETKEKLGYPPSQLADPPQDAAETDIPFSPGALWGVGKVWKVEFLDIDAGSILTLNPLRLIQKNASTPQESTIFICPAFLKYDTPTFGWTTYDAITNRVPQFWHPQGCEQLIGLNNYHAGLSLPYSYFEFGAYKNIGFPSLSQTLARILESPGYSVQINGSSDDLRNPDVYAGGDLSPVRWNDSLGDLEPSFYTDRSVSGETELYAHLLCDLVDVYPGCGNPQLPRSAGNVSYPLKYIAQRGAFAHGTVHDETTKQPLSDVEVRIKNGVTLKSAVTSNASGYFRSSLLETKVLWQIETDEASGDLQFSSARLRHAAILGSKETSSTASPSVVIDEDLSLIWITYEANENLVIQRTNSQSFPFEWLIVPIANTADFTKPHLSLERKTNHRQLVLTCLDASNHVVQLKSAAGGMKELEWTMTTLVSGASAGKRPHSKYLEDQSLKLVFYCKNGNTYVNRYRQDDTLIDTILFLSAEVEVDSCYSKSRGMIVVTYTEGTDVKEKISKSDGKEWS